MNTRSLFALIILFMTVVMVHSMIPSSAKSIPYQQARDWRNCYGEQTDESIQVVDAVVTFVPTAHANTPGIKLSVWFNSTMNTQLQSLLYRFELWHEHTGAKIKYRGDFEEIFVTTNSDDSHLIEIARPLHVDYDGVYEASIVLYNNKPIEGLDVPRTEMDEKLCVDVKFKFFLDKENLAQWHDKTAQVNKEERQLVDVANTVVDHVKNEL